MKKFLQKRFHVPVLFQFISLSKLQGPEFAPFLTQAFSANSNFATAVNALFKGAIAIGAILAVLQLARAGFMYMGGESWGTKEKAKQIMREAVMGLILLLSVWLILNQINPDILDLNVLRRMESQKSGTFPANTGEAPL